MRQGRKRESTLSTKTELPSVRSVSETDGALWNQDDFSGGARFEDFFVSAGGFGEGEFFADDGAQRAIFEASDNTGVDVGFFRSSEGPKGKASNRAAPAH